MALACCAVLSGVQQLTLKDHGAFVANNPRGPFGYPLGFHGRASPGLAGRIISYHKMDSQQALCMSRKLAMLGSLDRDESLRRVPPECERECFSGQFSPRSVRELSPRRGVHHLQ